MIESLEERTLPSGARILVPAGWRAEEVPGLSGVLPYLSDARMSGIVYLVTRPLGMSVEAGLDLAPALGGADPARLVWREVTGESGVAVWDQGTAGVHHVLVGRVTEAYVGVLATTSEFCPSGSPIGEDEAQEYAKLLQRMVDSYAPGP